MFEGDQRLERVSDTNYSETRTNITSSHLQSPKLKNSIEIMLKQILKNMDRIYEKNKNKNRIKKEKRIIRDLNTMNHGTFTNHIVAVFTSSSDFIASKKYKLLKLNKNEVL